MQESAKKVVVLLFVAVLLTLLQLCNSMPQLLIENAVLAEPRVDCGLESIHVFIRTERPFQGSELAFFLIDTVYNYSTEVIKRNKELLYISNSRVEYMSMKRRNILRY
jgi:hypothetical protein